MKRLFTLLMVLLFAATALPAFAEGTDLAAMTDEELHSLIDAYRNELTRRELVAGEKVVLFEQDGISVYLTGEYKVYGNDDKFLTLEVVVINDGDVEISISADDYHLCINGWDCFTNGIGKVPAGKKLKGELSINLSHAEISTYEEIEDIEFSFIVSDAETFKELFTTDPVTVHFNVQ